MSGLGVRPGVLRMANFHGLAPVVLDPANNIGRAAIALRNELARRGWTN